MYSNCGCFAFCSPFQVGYWNPKQRVVVEDNSTSDYDSLLIRNKTLVVSTVLVSICLRFGIIIRFIMWCLRYGPVVTAGEWIGVQSRVGTEMICALIDIRNKFLPSFRLACSDIWNGIDAVSLGRIRSLQSKRVELWSNIWVWLASELSRSVGNRAG